MALWDNIYWSFDSSVNILSITGNRVVIIFLIGAVVWIALLIFLWGSLGNYKKMAASKEQEEHTSRLLQAFLDANMNMVAIKDENRNYVFLNQGTAQFYHMPQEALLGNQGLVQEYQWMTDKLAEGEIKVLSMNAVVTNIVQNRGNTYRIHQFPVNLADKKKGVGSYIIDISRERDMLRDKINEQNRQEIVANILTRKYDSKETQLDYVLEEALHLTKSEYGYIYYYDEGTQEFTLNSWTKGAMKDCDIMEKQTLYHLNKTGIWGEVVRQRVPIVMNQFDAPSPLKKGYPKGHVELHRFLSIPVIADEKIVAVLGLANKADEYTDGDVYEMTLLMSGVWNAIERRENQEKSVKYLNTIMAMVDGVIVVDAHHGIELMNEKAQELTGYTKEDIKTMSFSQIFKLRVNQEILEIDLFQVNHVQNSEQETLLIGKYAERYIEYSNAVIENDQGKSIGGIVVFRDVTDKVEIRRKIAFISHHDALTGLANRRFFEEELLKRDVESQYPLCIMVGDVNGLKLINDVFGHEYGDELLKKVAQVLTEVCRSTDLVARWGGDEFYILATGTDQATGEAMVEQIRKAFGAWDFKSIKGSISMGVAVKNNPNQQIQECLREAEERMYVIKLLEKNRILKSAVSRIMETIHTADERERIHAENVSHISVVIGNYLQWPESEVCRLKEAAFLHDIGKITTFSENSDYQKSRLEEYKDQLKTHPSVGYRILNMLDETADLAQIVLSHHEAFDGSGYPNGLRGNQIPEMSRIIRICEDYDRMVESKPHPTLEEAKAAYGRTVLDREHLYDPQMMDALKAVIEEGRL